MLLFATVAIQSCKKDDDNTDATKTEIKTTYANIVFANYEDSYNDAVVLRNAIYAFTATPTATTFNAAQNAWLSARESYGQTEAFRFAGGPIDDADGPEGLINAWPLDPQHILTYIQGAGVINGANLEAENENGGEKNISVGYHALEFLLWGEDNIDPSNGLPGQRDFNDFVGIGTGPTRSRLYMETVADLLVGHLEDLKDEWKPGGTFRTTWLALDNNTALTHMLTGIGTLSKSELAGERIFTALFNQSQEDEHSCFSDNTDRDIRLNIYGVRNVYNGSYTRNNNTVVSGASLNALLGKVDATLAAQVTAQLNAAVSDVEATYAPFDVAISNNAYKPAVQTAINSLRNLGDKFSEAGTKLDLTVNTELPE